MGHTWLCVLGLFSLNTLFHGGQAEDAVLTLKPNWPTLFTEESVTFTCDIREVTDDGWSYTFSRNGQQLDSCSTNKSCSFKIMKNCSGEYHCTGHHLSTNVSKKSNNVTLNVSDKPRPVLTVSPLWLSPGDSVTLKLNCSVEDSSAGWRFNWFKSVPKLLNNSFSYKYEPRSGYSNWTKEDFYIVHEWKHTAGYKCRARRGDPVYYTAYSKNTFVWSKNVHSLSVKVSPDGGPQYLSDSVSLSCEGNSTQWRVMRFTKAGHLSNCSEWGSMNGSTCKILKPTNKAAVYWCESGSGQFSNAVNMTVQRPPQESSSFLMPLIVGLLCGILLIILLLLLCYCIKSKDSYFSRCTQSQRTNQGSVPDQVVETQPKEHSSHLHGADESHDVTYSLIQLKNINKGQSSPAAKEETVYSEVQLRTSFGP
uniref:Ig-like domain-containing protein n=1 Tax=Dicentrarchus labrax TaxID=13489 RepID=A0A8P4KQJ8_DICLA